MLSFFLSYRRTLSEQHVAVFGGGGNSEVAAKYGWYHTFYILAGEDATKMDEVERWPIERALTHLLYLKDLAYERKKNANNKSNRQQI